MRGVPPGGKTQLLHMAEEGDDKGREEQEVELLKGPVELFALLLAMLIKQTKQLSQMSSSPLFL